jgi:GMP synthase-like glutamine amidotransferase
MLLAIYNHPIEHLGNFKKLIPMKIKEIYAEDLKGDETFEDLIIMGGPQSVYNLDKYPYLEKEIDLIKRAHMSNKRILGVCLGAQLISKALGGEVWQGSFGPELGVQEIEVLGDFVKVFRTNKITVFQWHGDTFTLPNNSSLLAFSNKYFQAFKIGRALAVQFHLEVNKEMVEEWIKSYNGDNKLLKDFELTESLLKENSEKLIKYWLIL